MSEPSVDLPVATWDQIFEMTEGELTEEDKQHLNEYLSGFVVLKEHRCVKCDKKLIGTLVDQLLGTTFKWGLVHGHGICGACGWPAVYYHFPKGGPLERFVCMLQVHPKYVTQKEATG